MNEQRSSHAGIPAFAGVMGDEVMTSNEEGAAMAPSAGADPDEAELSDEDLEYVVGGLARAWLPPGEGPSNEGDDGAAAYLPLES